MGEACEGRLGAVFLNRAAKVWKGSQAPGMGAGCTRAGRGAGLEEFRRQGSSDLSWPGCLGCWRHGEQGAWGSPPRPSGRAGNSFGIQRLVPLCTHFISMNTDSNLACHRTPQCRLKQASSVAQAGPKTYHIAQAGIELVADLLPQHCEFWDYKQQLGYSALTVFFSGLKCFNKKARICFCTVFSS